jgi:hypothetical protein
VKGDHGEGEEGSQAGRSLRERGQVILMVGLATLVMFGIVGLAVDVGRLYVTRVELGRSVDAAALSGILEFNGTPAGLTNAVARAENYFQDNEAVTTCDGSQGVWCQAVANPNAYEMTVDATKTMNTTFLSVLGIKTANVSAHAKAGFGAEPLDVVIVLDDTGTMRNTCNGQPSVPSSQTNATCPVKQARDGAKAMIDALPIGCGGCAAQVAIAPFRGCVSNNSNRYNPAPFPEGAPFDVMANYALRGCIAQSDFMNLSNNPTALKNKIDTFSASGGYPGTNVCLGMYEAYQRLTGPGAQAGARKIMVILTDGDSRYSDGASNSSRGNSPVPGVYDTATWPSGQGSGSIPTDCRPSGPAYNSGSGWDVPEANDRINRMDVGTYNYKQTLVGLGVEIYVLRFSVPADDNDVPGNLCTPAWIILGTFDRNPSSDPRDQNIARCLATSSAGTNDHYFYAATPQEIPGLFSIIALDIAHRLIE